MIDTLKIYVILTEEDYNSLYKTVDDAARKSGSPLYPEVRTDYKKRYKTCYLCERGFLEIVFEKSFLKKRIIRKLEIKLKPKLLIDPGNYSDVTYYFELKKVAFEFNRELKKISPMLPDFFYWKATRIDFAITIWSNIVGKYIKLLKRGDIYEPFKAKADEYFCVEGSLYLKGDVDGVYVNLYDKEDERKNNGDGYGEIEKFIKAINKMRLEVQCRKEKLKNLKNKYGLKSMAIGEFLTNLNICKDVICEYYLMVAGTHDYYKLKKAAKIIEENEKSLLYSPEELLATLALIFNIGSIWKASDVFEKRKNAFDKRLRELKRVGINPVIIPDDWEEKHIPNIYSDILKMFDKIETGKVSILYPQNNNVEN